MPTVSAPLEKQLPLVAQGKWGEHLDFRPEHQAVNRPISNLWVSPRSKVSTSTAIPAGMPAR